MGILVVFCHSAVIFRKRKISEIKNLGPPHTGHTTVWGET